MVSYNKQYDDDEERSFPLSEPQTVKGGKETQAP